MTITRTLRYVCGHEESVRLSGGRVGVLPATYTIAVPFECGGRACRGCGPVVRRECQHIGFVRGPEGDYPYRCRRPATRGAFCGYHAPRATASRNDETPRHRAAGRVGTATGTGAR